jgi:hypothetical protein
MLARTSLRDQMIAWLETQNPAEHYSWGSNDACACGQFAKSIGRYDDWRSRRGHATLDDEAWINLSIIARLGTHRSSQWTFGNFLQALRKVGI